MTTLPPAATDTMTLERARGLARELGDEINRDDANEPSFKADIKRLCDLILSDDLKREIENAAYRKCLDIADKAWLDHGRGKSANNFTVTQIVSDIRSLIQPPAQKENGE